MNVFELFTFPYRKKYHISIPKYHTTLAMEAPPASNQQGPEMAGDGLRKHEPGIYGPIDPKYYLPRTWTRCSIHAMEQVQFSKFVTFVIGRFRSKAGRLEEVPLFVNLLNTEGDFDFMTPALEQIPEWRMEP